MPMLGRLIKLASSPQGRKLIVEAQRLAQDPKNRERIAQARARLQKRRP